MSLLNKEEEDAASAKIKSTLVDSKGDRERARERDGREILGQKKDLVSASSFIYPTTMWSMIIIMAQALPLIILFTLL